MTGEAPWMGVTPQPPSDSEPRVFPVTEAIGANWTEADARAMMERAFDALLSAATDARVDPTTCVLRIDLTVEVPWAD